MGEAGRPLAAEFLAAACTALGIDIDRLTHGAGGDADRAFQELVALLGVGAFGLHVNELAGEVHEPPETVGRWLARGAMRRRRDRRFASRLAELEERLIAAS